MKMNESVPRILVSGTKSGCGKTTAVTAILAHMKLRGLRPRAFKCGPDYIDPMFHARVTGVPCSNLDTFFSSADSVRRILCERSDKFDAAVIEGAMGYYDGTGNDMAQNSAYEIATVTDSPAVIVADGRGASASVAASVCGFADFVPDSHVAGIIINNVSPSVYDAVKNCIESRLKNRVRMLGYIPRLPDAAVFDSRHLGLVTANEVANLRGKVDLIVSATNDTLDIDGILSLARGACALSYQPIKVPRFGPIKVAIAYDHAFSFYYEENLDILRRMGAEISAFSPLADEEVPDDADMLYLGGGYPELYADLLSRNMRARRSVAAAVGGGMPTVAECGGFIYLGGAIKNGENVYPMCGVLPHTTVRRSRLVRFGYVTLTPSRPCVFGDACVSLRGHEFHYCDSEDAEHNGSDMTAVKPSGVTYSCAVCTDTMYAGYPHIWFGDNIEAAANLYKKCVEYKRRREGE